MYILWGIGLVGGVILIALVVAALLPRTFTVQREIVIDRPVGDVFNFLKNLRNQPAFSMWSQMDPAMEKSFRGTDGNVGSVYAWNSQEKNVGVGELELTGLEDNRRIELEIRFVKPFVSTDPTVIECESLGPGRTQIRQTYYGKLPYPMNMLCSAVSKTIGDGMEKTFQNLKGVLENSSATL